ncbi:hypothetical protein APF79_07515 [bacterium BRH_c32]|nr:MAG: hypothetical protein APF79_07515 [bacterium BRH_c32]
MEVVIKDPVNSVQELEVTIPYSEITEDIEKAYLEERKNIELPGFRKGKVPVSMLKKMFKEAIEYRASEKIANRKFWDAVDENNLKPISTPQLTDIDFVPDEKLFFKVNFEIKPKLDLKDYTNLEIEKPVFKLRQEEVDKEKEHLLKTHIQYNPAEAVDNKDFRITVNLDRTDKDGVSLGNPKSENILIQLNDEKVNKDIVENAIGKNIGESFTFSFTDEHFHGEEKHVEEFHYSAEIIKIEKIELPELTDELVKTVTKNKANNAAELEEQIKDNLTKFYTQQSEEIYLNSLLDKIVKNNDFEAPKGYVEMVHKRFIEMERKNAARYGNKNFDETAVSEYYKPRSLWNAKWQIILENLSEKENIKVDESQLEELARIESEKTGISADKLMNYYKENNRIDALLEEKVMDFLKSNNKPIEIDAEEKSKKDKV